MDTKSSTRLFIVIDGLERESQGAWDRLCSMLKPLIESTQPYNKRIKITVTNSEYPPAYVLPCVSPPVLYQSFSIKEDTKESTQLTPDTSFNELDSLLTTHLYQS